MTIDVGTVLIGLGGGVLGGLATRLNDRTRWRRDSRANAYEGFLAAVRSVEEVGTRIYLPRSKERREGGEVSQEALAAELAELWSLTEQLKYQSVRVEIAGSRAAARMAQNFSSSVESFEIAVRRDGSDFIDEWRYWMRMEGAQFEDPLDFLRLARDELGTREIRERLEDPVERTKDWFRTRRKKPSALSSDETPF